MGDTMNQGRLIVISKEVDSLRLQCLLTGEVNVLIVVRSEAAGSAAWNLLCAFGPTAVQFWSQLTI